MRRRVDAEVWRRTTLGQRAGRRRRNQGWRNRSQSDLAASSRNEGWQESKEGRPSLVTCCSVP